MPRGRDGGPHILRVSLVSVRGGSVGCVHADRATSGPEA